MAGTGVNLWSEQDGGLPSLFGSREPPGRPRPMATFPRLAYPCCALAESLRRFGRNTAIFGLRLSSTRPTWIPSAGTFLAPLLAHLAQADPDTQHAHPNTDAHPYPHGARTPGLQTSTMSTSRSMDALSFRGIIGA